MFSVLCIPSSLKISKFAPDFPKMHAMTTITTTTTYLSCTIGHAVSHIHKQSTNVTFLQEAFNTGRKILEQAHRVPKDVEGSKKGGNLTLEGLDVVVLDM